MIDFQAKILEETMKHINFLENILTSLLREKGNVLFLKSSICLKVYRFYVLVHIFSFMLKTIIRLCLKRLFNSSKIDI